MGGSSEVDCVYIYWKDREETDSTAQLVGVVWRNKLAGMRGHWGLSLEPNGYGI